MTSAAAALLLAGCSKLSGEIKTSHFMASSNYEELVVNDGFEVEFSDEASDLLITVDESLLSKVVVRERDGELTIGLKPFTSAHGSPLKAVLPYNRNIDKITLTGASVLRSARPIEGEELSIRLSGASELEAELNADEIDMELSGASVAKISGMVRPAFWTITASRSTHSRPVAAANFAPSVVLPLAGGP